MGSAAVFFLGALVHMATWLCLALRAPRASPVHYRASGSSFTSFAFKLCCCGGSVAPLPTSLLYHPASPLTRGRELSLVDQGGLQQWVLADFSSARHGSPVYPVSPRIHSLVITP